MTRERNVVAAGELFRGIVMSQILAVSDDPAEMKARIMIAREHGHIDGQMCADLIAIHQLEGA